jgi:hypothetical protein
MQFIKKLLVRVSKKGVKVKAGVKGGRGEAI